MVFVVGLFDASRVVAFCRWRGKCGNGFARAPSPRGAFRFLRHARPPGKSFLLPENSPCQRKLCRRKMEEGQTMTSLEFGHTKKGGGHGLSRQKHERDLVGVLCCGCSHEKEARPLVWTDLYLSCILLWLSSIQETFQDYNSSSTSTSVYFP